MPSWIRLTVLLSALTVHCFLDGTCPRRDPPPRVLVVSPGSVLVLACSGQVEVNGLEVTVNRAKHTSTIARNGKYTSVITGVHPSTVSTTTNTTSNGTTVSTTTDTTSNGTTVSTTTDTTSNGTFISTTTDTTSNGTTVSTTTDTTSNGTTVSTTTDTASNGTTVSTTTDTTSNGTTVSTTTDTTSNGTTVSAIKDGSDNGTTVSTIKDGSDNGTTVSTIKDGSDNGTTVSTIKDGSDNGTTVSAIKDGSDNGTTVSAIKDGSDNGTTVSTIKDGSDNGIDTFSTGKDTIVLTVTDTPVTDDTGTDSREKTVIRNTRAGNHTLTVREVNKGNVEDVTEEEHKGGGEQRDTGRSLFTVNQPGHTDTQKLFPLTGTSLQPTRDSGVGGADTELSSNRWTDAMDSEHDYEEEEEGGRMMRGLRGRSQWRLNGRPLRGGEERGGVVVLGRRGATLTLSSLAVGDSGNYSCHRGGKLVSSLRVSVAVPPERPKLSCYKRSPSSKIRCDWTASQPVTPVPQCYLLLRKGLSGSFSRVNCSYSALLSRCWCAIGHQEKESREPHLAYLCVTNTAGNTTSPLLDFTPLDIINPDPPSSVVVRGVEGQERRLRVGWAVPHSWKERDRYHELLYELRYHTMPHGTQIKGTTTARFYTITDALPGVQYLIQLRAKEEFDGHWSEWSTAVYANTWTAPVPTAFSDLSTVMQDYTDNTDSGSGMTEETSVSESRGDVEVWPHVLWVVASCVLLSITLLSTYLYRHRERFLSKLWRLSPVSSSPACPSPPVTALPTQEGHALVNFDHPIYGEPVPQEEERKEEDEEEEEEEKGEVIRFNNTSYFLVQSK
ncbi:interleukin-6 receptor subunit alpha precursor [Oncorhynchus mykiss]|uniref:IL-6R alpha n=1 Tax=Oncorhynchus mykiss TaxID=8022 RepID=G7Z193_ONCMY|nr:interleukin-6 receptor subunit alpha precursor [Oncorhynchus mykiss]CBL94872.1 IL-6R alpha precursor [Oncorhynchus mykiss]